MVVIDAGSTGCQVREVALAVADVHRSANVKRVWVLHRTDEFVNADGLNLLRVLLTVSVGSFDDNFDLFVGFGVGQSGFL